MSVTAVPAGKLAVHTPGQLMPAGILVTAPVPAPVTATLSTAPLGALGAKVAVTLRTPPNVTAHVTAPLVHAPPHPANVLPAAAAAVSVTVAPTA
jgi:hypothetical protein